MQRLGLSQNLQQKLSPQQIQLMKLLQIPTATLDQRIQEELEVNPALEEGDETADLSEGLSDMDLSDADLNYYEKEKNYGISAIKDFFILSNNQPIARN